MNVKKDIKIKKFGEYYFYKSFDILNQKTLTSLLKECEELFTYHKDSTEDYPPETTYTIVDANILNKYPALNKYVYELQKHVKIYKKISKIKGNVKIHSGWVTRVTKENYNIDSEKYNSFTPIKNLHSHLDLHIGSIFYLKTPSKKCGTIVMFNDHEYYSNKGEENSVLLYNPELEHSGIYPTPEELDLSPRYTIIFDFIAE